MKFSGKNFQPWPSFELDIEGLTIVIGPSNEGKSALYRALRGILRNEIDASFIRDPKNEPLELTFEANGYAFTAKRSKKGSVHYVVSHESLAQPKEYAKLDEAIPDEVKSLNMGEIKVGDFSFDPIFAPQNRPQFLIDNKAFKPSEVNAILGAFGGTEKLEAGKKQANLLKTQKDSEARVLAGQIRNSEEKKAELEGMSAKAHAIEAALRSHEHAAGQLELEAGWLAEAARRLRQLEPLEEIVEALVLPDATGIERIQQAADLAEQAAFSAQFARWANKPLQAIEAATEGWGGAVALWKQIKALDEASELVLSHPDTQGLAGFQTSVSATELNGLWDSIICLESAVALRKGLKETAGKLAAIDEQLSAAQTELAAGQKALHDAALEAERQQAQKKAEEWAAKGLCPKCGKPLEHICL